MKSYVRPIAIVVIKRERPVCQRDEDDAILVFEGYDSHKDQIFYRPLGGTIEFGEPAEQTVHRELREELNLELCDVHYLGTIENIFTCEGQPGHEIVMIFSARLAAATAHVYDQDDIRGAEDDWQPFLARWMPLSHFGPDRLPLYPTGLFELLIEEK